MKVGAPAKYKSNDELVKAIEDYFDNGVEFKTVVREGVAINVPLITITGLVLHIGFESRQSFYDLEKRPEFSYTIKKARTLIENEYEKLLQVGNTTGAIFALKNFGWIDKQTIDSNIKANAITHNINIKDGRKDH